MLQNLDISDTLLSLGIFIKKDEAIKEFCTQNFTKDLSVYVGDFTRQTIPSVADSPYIVLTDFSKKEGQNIDFCEYHVTAIVGLSVDVLADYMWTNATDTRWTGAEYCEWGSPPYISHENVLMLDVFDVGAKFMTLLESIFNDKTKRYRPLSRCETTGPQPLDAKHWFGMMELTWRIYQTLGLTYQEEL